MPMQQERDDAMNQKRSFNIVYALMVMHQRALTVPMRNRWGVNALGMSCALALILMFVWTMVTQDSLMFCWIGFWLLCFIKRRVEAVRLVNKGERIHSQADGLPFDALRLCRSENTAKLVVEPILVGVLGGVLYWIYEQNGWRPTGLPYFILSGVVTLPFVELVKQTIWKRRTQQMLDARIENEASMKAYRDKYGDS
jgi:hypothetical protein